MTYTPSQLARQIITARLHGEDEILRELVQEACETDPAGTVKALFEISQRFIEQIESGR